MTDQHYDRTTIQEERLPAKCAPVIDADTVQAHRFKLRDQK